MVQLVVELSKRTQIPVSGLLKSYGNHLFGVFTSNYSHFFENVADAFQFFEQIDRYIHVEVQKLYPDAELPRFETERTGENTLVMIYESERKMSDLAEGLIESALKHYNENASVEKENINLDGSLVKFTIRRV